MTTKHFLSCLFYIGSILISRRQCTRISCHEPGECSESYFVCKDDEECVINCAGDHSCRSTHILCPQDHVCFISCSGDDATSESICEYLTVNASRSSYLSISGSSHWNTLRSSVVHCPYGGPCDINANGRHIMTFMDVYAVQGFTDLNIRCTDCYLGDLYCTESFEHNCHIDAALNQCQAPCNSLYEERESGHRGQICNDYSLPTPLPTESPSSESPSATPTANPSATPTANPSATPTANPSANPSATPTAHPSASPTAYPSLSPTDSPSANPSSQPTYDPSSDPSLSPLTSTPSTFPSVAPSATPSKTPSVSTQPPSTVPSTSPTADPSQASMKPSLSPSKYPSQNPSFAPSVIPTETATTQTESAETETSKLETTETVVTETVVTETEATEMKTTESDTTKIVTSELQSTETETEATETETTEIEATETETTEMESTETGELSTETGELSEICDSNCAGDSAISIELKFEFSSNVMYNSNNLNCFMYNIFYEYFHNRFDFAQDFDVCDVSTVFLSGGQEIAEGCDGFVPCFTHAQHATKRLLLQTATTDSSSDITIYIYFIANNDDTFTVLHGSKVSITNMEKSVAKEFKHKFGLIVDAVTKNITLSEDYLKIVKIQEPGDGITEEQEDNGLMGSFSGTRDQWICVGTFLGVLAVLFPFEIYYTLKLYKARGEPFIHTRHPILNTLINLFAALFLVIERPMHAIHRLSVYNELWFEWLRLSFYFLAMQFLLGGVVLRFWLLLFEVKWTQSMINKEWKKHIDVTIGTKTESFWMRCHGTWGNINFIWKYIVTICILLGAVPIFLAYTNKEYFIGSMAHGVLLGSGVLLLYILWRGTPIFHDEFKIMEECGFVVTWIGVAILMDLVFTSLKIIFSETFWIWFLSFSVPFLLLSGVIFIQSYWVLSEWKRSKILNSMQAYQTKLNLELLEPNDEKEMMESMSLYEIIADKIGCYEFIAHLLKEFSFENLSSVIEMTQYKQCFLEWKRYKKLHDDEKKENDDDDDDDNMNYDNPYDEPLRSDSEHSLNVQDIELYGERIIELPRNLPRSTIVWNVSVELLKLDDFRNMIFLLYAKYIKFGSELELNISYKTRKETTRQYTELQNLDELQLYTFFDGTLAAMIKLMQDSYSRFRMTKGFIKYEMRFMQRRNSSKPLILNIKKKLTPSPRVSVSS